jgi:hypothetical protein
MIWAKRSFEYAEYAPYMDRLENLLFANPTLYRQFIMVAVDLPRSRSRAYYVGVPNDTFLDPFDGFEMVHESALPSEIDTVLIADQTSDEFRSRFRFRSARRSGAL